MDYNTIDWNVLWQQASSRSPYSQGIASQKELWNKRAANFNKRISRVTEGTEELDKDDYISKMLERIEVKPDWSVLDIGCGPGTLAIPLARKAKSVTGLDLSSEMLKHLKENADKNGLKNIDYLNVSWQEGFDARNIQPHDVVIASRCLVSGDMKAVISNINATAVHSVYLTLPIVHLPFDWEVYKVIGRSGKKHAPYIYFYNLLYQMGITANVEILRSRVKVQFTSIENAVEDLQWRNEAFSAEEKEKLMDYLKKKFSEHKESPVFTHEGFSKWALIWWKKEEQSC
jgi:SAM-dependent methyltransferase